MGRHPALLAVGCVLVLVFGGCGESPSDEAFRELVGEWQLDAEASLQATLDGNLFTQFLPREQVVEALSRSEQRPSLTLRIQPDGRASLQNPASERALSGQIEDAGNAFLVHFRQGDAESGDEVARVTLEFQRRDEVLHAWVVGAKGEQTESALEMLQYVGLAGSLHLVFVPRG